MPLYRIEATLGESAETRIVEAKTEAGALKHAAKRYMSAAMTFIRSAEQIKVMAALVAEGVKVETTDAE